MKIGHLNINSIRNKFQPLSQILQNNVLDILFVQETKIDDSFPHAQFHVNGYKLHRNDCTCTAGGIMVYIRDDIAHRRRQDLEQYSISDERGRLELLCIDVNIRNEQWLFVSVYKQPKL